MKNIRPYKGYFAFVDYDPRDKIYYGYLENALGDLVDFQAYYEDDVEEQFHKAVDDYLEFCKEIGKNSQMSGGCNDNH